MRFGAAIGLGFVLLVVRSTIVPRFGLYAIAPDLAFPLVVFYGASGRFSEGLVVTLVLGHLADLMSGGTFGVHLLMYTVAFALANLAQGRVDLEGALVPCVLVLALYAVAGFTLNLLHGLWGIELQRPAGGLGREALLTAAATLLLLPVLHRLKQLSRKEDRLILPG